MGLLNQDNRVKRDLTGTRTSEDVMRRLAKNVQITTDEVKGLTIEVSGKVGNDEIISRINQSAEAVSINANKVNLTGYVTASDLSGSGTTTINGANITTGTLSADRVSGGTLTGTSIIGNTITNGTNFSVDTAGNMTCNNATMSNATMSNATITSGNITIPESTQGYGVEVHGVGSDGVTTYYTRQRAAALSCFRNDVLMARMHDGSTSTAGGILQLYNASGTMTIQGNGATGVITCTSVNPSLEENKKNIEKFDKGLQVVKDTDIYRFNYKYENDDIKRHIGFVIGDKYNYSKEITSQGNDGAELYSMISVLWAAVKEQQEQIEELRKLVNK